MKRPVASPVGKKGSWECPDRKWLERFPNICSYMCDPFWDDGKARELSSISINFSSGLPTVGLSDHALQRSLYSTGETVEDALEQLEQALVSGKGKWRAWKAGKGR